MQATVTNKLSFEFLNQAIFSFGFLSLSTFATFYKALAECTIFVAILVLCAGLFILLAGLKYKKAVFKAMLFILSFFYGFIVCAILTSSVKPNPIILLLLGLIFGAIITRLYSSWSPFTLILSNFLVGSLIFVLISVGLAQINVPYEGIIAMLATIVALYSIDFNKYINKDLCMDLAICLFGCSLLVPLCKTFQFVSIETLLLIQLIAFIASYFGQRYYWDLSSSNKE